MADESFIEKAKKIRFIVMDVDGVLTDGRIIYGSNNIEIKCFHALDGLGMNVARKAGIEFAIITGRVSDALTRRAWDLKITRIYQKVSNKATVLKQVCESAGITLDEVAFIGDDFNDLPALELAGMRIAVANAADEIKQISDYVTVKSGGYGAVREVIEAIMKAQNRWDSAVQEFLKDLKAEETPCQ